MRESFTSNPSDQWPAFSDSEFSCSHLDQKTKKIRSMPWYVTVANLTKMYVGISFIASPKSVS